jgi:hypothetical protein
MSCEINEQSVTRLKTLVTLLFAWRHQAAGTDAVEVLGAPKRIVRNAR